jgi:copper chaperone CopZ
MSHAAMVVNVPGMTCGHCEAAVITEVSAVDGVTEVEVDLTTKQVIVRGVNLDRDAVHAAIDEAGFEVA